MTLPDNFRIEVVQADGRTVLMVFGELDMATVPDLRVVEITRTEGLLGFSDSN